MPSSLMDFAVILGVVFAGLQTVITYRAERRARVERSLGKPRRPIWFMVLLMMLSWAAVGADYVDRTFVHYTKPTVIAAYGVVPPGIFYLVADGNTLLHYGSLKRAVLITRVAYSDVDKMSDTYIGKSVSYSLTAGPVNLAFSGFGGMRIRGDVPVPVEFYLVVIPFLYSPDQLHSLDDVAKLSGEIVDARALTTQFAPMNPSAACPPTPASPDAASKK